MSRVLKTGKYRITQGFSWRHKAVDLVKAPSLLDEIIAHSAGKVVFCQTGQKNAKGSWGNKSYGNCVRIDHGNGYSTLYAHMSKVYVKLNEEVKEGQVIGYMGNTGNSYGAHLHFEVRKDNVRINPIEYLDKDLPIRILPKKTVEEIAKEVLQGKWGNGADRKQRLEKAGYSYRDVQSKVNEIMKKPMPKPQPKPVPKPKPIPKPTPQLKSNEEIAREILKGLWGNGLERKNKLEKAGYNYIAVQSEVKKLLNKPKVPTKKSNEEIAAEVIRGKWGNGWRRRSNLRKAGYNPSDIQRIVNNLLKK